MLERRTIAEISALARVLSYDEFRERLGPFVLTERPAGTRPVDDRRSGGGCTMAFEATDIVARMMLVMLGPEGSTVVPTPGLLAGGTLVVGRLLPCDLLLEHPSVSKRHATIGWDPAAGLGSVSDLGSMNGTFVNGERNHGSPRALEDGDLVGFGDVVFSYRTTADLHNTLSSSLHPDGDGEHGDKRRTIGSLRLATAARAASPQSEPAPDAAGDSKPPPAPR